MFTDRHAYLSAANYLTDVNDLSKIQWELLQQRDFKTESGFQDKKERYQAEALVHRHVPVCALFGMACYNSDMEQRLRTLLVEAGVKLSVAVRREWYFE